MTAVIPESRSGQSSMTTCGCESSEFSLQTILTEASRIRLDIYYTAVVTRQVEAFVGAKISDSRCGIETRTRKFSIGEPATMVSVLDFLPDLCSDACSLVRGLPSFDCSFRHVARL